MKFLLKESSIDFKGIYRDIEKLVTSYSSINHKRGLTELRECLASIAHVDSSLYHVHHKDRNESNNDYTNLMLVPSKIHSSIHKEAMKAAIEKFLHDKAFNYHNNYKIEKGSVEYNNIMDCIRNNIESVYNDYYLYYLDKMYPHNLAGCINIEDYIVGS